MSIDKGIRRAPLHSLDDCARAAEELGWTFEIATWQDGRAEAIVWLNDDEEAIGTARAPTPQKAFALALCRAIKAKEDHEKERKQ